MAKPIKKKSADNLKKLAADAMVAFIEESMARKNQAEIIFRRQDDETRDAIERMASLLTRIARRQMWFSVGGSGDKIVREIPEAVIEDNMFYMAVEICKDLAHMDVRIQQFVIPRDLCVECHVEIKPAKKKSVAKKKGVKRG